MLSAVCRHPLGMQFRIQCGALKSKELMLENLLSIAVMPMDQNLNAQTQVSQREPDPRNCARTGCRINVSME
jgi:hypothetical protein